MENLYLFSNTLNAGLESVFLRALWPAGEPLQSALRPYSGSSWSALGSFLSGAGTLCCTLCIRISTLSFLRVSHGPAKIKHIFTSIILHTIKVRRTEEFRVGFWDCIWRILRFHSMNNYRDTYQQLVVHRFNNDLFGCVLTNVESQLEALLVAVLLDQRRVDLVVPRFNIAALSLLRQVRTGCVVWWSRRLCGATEMALVDG